MKVIIKGRGEGKTSELIAMSGKTKLPIICGNRERVRYVETLANKMEVFIPNPITFFDSRDSDRLRGIRGVLIDDVDKLLPALIGVEVIAVTVTKE